MQTGTISFDQGKPAARSKDINGVPVLLQNGCMFTNAEMNKFTNKFEPEPQYIAEHEPYRTYLAPKVLALIELVQKLDDTVSQLIEPLKLVLANEKIIKKPMQGGMNDFVFNDLDEQGGGTKGIEEKEFKYLGEHKLKKWAENNKERIKDLTEDNPVLDALIEKWEKTYGNEPFIDLI